MEIKKTLTSIVLAGALALGVAGCNGIENYGAYGKTVQIEGIVQNESGSVVKGEGHVNPYYKGSRTLGFDIDGQSVVVGETKNEHYEKFLKEVHNGDKVRVTVRARVNYPFGDLAYYLVDSDKIEVLEKAKTE